MKRNFLILTVVAIAIPVITVSASLVAYNLSGDKYLDRSRPGYMPEDSGETDELPSNTFSDSGPIDTETLDEYLQNLDQLTRYLTSDSQYFGPHSLSDESLGLTDGSIPDAD